MAMPRPRELLTARRLVPLLLVPAVSAVLVAFRPQLATAPLMSWRAFVVMAGVGVGGLLALSLVWRRSAVRAIWTADLVVLALMAAVVWPVFRERTVVEDFPPVLAASPLPTTSASPSPRAVPTRVTSPAPKAAAPRSARPSAVPSPSVVATRLSAGSLRGIDHHAEGGVALYRLGDRVVLRFEGVDIEGTPTPSVHLVPAGQESPEGGIRLGGLKGEKGSFSYTVPTPYDPARAWDALVWCDRYAVPIAAADLS